MTDNGYSDWGFALFAIAAAVILGIVYFSVIKPLNERRQYIKMEMHRAKSEEGKRYWKHEMKKLYKSYLPFGGKKKRQRK